MVKPYLNKIDGEVDNDVSMFTGGLNTYVNKAFLEADQMPYVMNMTISQPPALRTRDARTSLSDKFPNKHYTWASDKIISMFAYNQKYIYFFINVSETNTYHLFLLLKNSTTGDYDQYDLASIPSSYEKPYFTFVKTGLLEYVYFGNENFKGKALLGNTDPALAVHIFDDNHYGIPVWHKNRLFLAKPTTGAIEWSNALLPDDFSIGPGGDSGELYINSTRGKITGLATFDDKLMVFCEHSTHAIYGHSGVPSDANYFQVVDILGKIGCLSMDHITVSGGFMYWLGDDKQVYEYTGSYINVVSKPSTTRNSTISVGGINNAIETMNVTTLMATTDKLYVDTATGYMFVFDTHNRTWWCEDGGFSTLANFSYDLSNLLMATNEGDIQIYGVWGGTGWDRVYDWEAGTITTKQIEYEFHTRVYGADGADLRETLSDIWLQMYVQRAGGSVYINDEWCDVEKTWPNRELDENRWKKIGEYSINPTMGGIMTYSNGSYEQKRFIVEKMFGQRLNTFQIIVKGTNYAEFYLMKRKWRVS